VDRLVDEEREEHEKRGNHSLGNPDNITSPADLRNYRVAKREFGAGTRVLLDRMLQNAGIPLHSVPGPESESHLEVALAIASGIAAVGLGLRAAAAALDLDFIPLVWERYDIVLPGSGLAADQLSGYDTADAGESQALPNVDVGR
jgi:molybdate-binding protein